MTLGHLKNGGSAQRAAPLFKGTLNSIRRFLVRIRRRQRRAVHKRQLAVARSPVLLN